MYELKEDHGEPKMMLDMPIGPIQCTCTQAPVHAKMDSAAGVGSEGRGLSRLDGRMEGCYLWCTRYDCASGKPFLGWQG